MDVIQQIDAAMDVPFSTTPSHGREVFRDALQNAKSEILALRAKNEKLLKSILEVRKFARASHACIESEWKDVFAALAESKGPQNG